MKKLILLLFVSATVASCSKEGPVGPRGPVGEPAAFMIEEFAVAPSEWTSFNTYGEAGYGFEVTFIWQDLTEPVLENSLVQIYQRFGDQLVPLPSTRFYSGYDDQNNYLQYSTVTDYVLTPLQVNLAIVDNDGFTTAPAEDTFFKVVVAEARARKSDIRMKIEARTGLRIVDSLEASNYPPSHRLKK